MENATAKWLIVALLGAVAACLLVEVGISVSSAQSAGQPPTASGGLKNVFAVAGQLTKDTYGLYLVHVEYGTICVYEWVPQKRELALRATRTYRFDSQLDEYNTKPPPREIKKLVSQQQRLDESPAQP